MAGDSTCTEFFDFDTIHTKGPMKLTLLKAAELFGVARETIRRGLAANGIETLKGATFTVRQIHEALAGDLRKARAREATANAIDKERKNRIADEELIPFEVYADFCRASHEPGRQRWDALPSVMAQRCNPSDPKFAQDALRQFADESLAMVDSQLAKLKKP